MIPPSHRPKKLSTVPIRPDKLDQGKKPCWFANPLAKSFNNRQYFPGRAIIRNIGIVPCFKKNYNLPDCMWQTPKFTLPDGIDYHYRFYWN